LLADATHVRPGLVAGPGNPDLRDVPEEVKKQIAFSFVATMDEVLRLALMPAETDGTPTPEPRLEPHHESSTPVPMTRESDAEVSADLV
jgi:hypothetical protein